MKPVLVCCVVVSGALVLALLVMALASIGA